MNLKVPPDQVALIADAIERDIAVHGDSIRTQQLTVTLTWLRHRLAKWHAAHPGCTAA